MRCEVLSDDVISGVDSIFLRRIRLLSIKLIFALAECFIFAERFFAAEKRKLSNLDAASQRKEAKAEKGKERRKKFVAKEPSFCS